jgi:tropomyosin
MDKIKEVQPFLSPLFSTDSFSKKLAALRAEADTAVERAEAAEDKNKKLEQLLLERDQDITSLNHKLEVLANSLDGSEEKLAATKSALEEAERGKATNDSLTRKIELLEDELDTAEKNLKETVEKCVPVSLPSLSYLICVPDSDR